MAHLSAEEREEALIHQRQLLDSLAAFNVVKASEPRPALTRKVQEALKVLRHNGLHSASSRQHCSITLNDEFTLSDLKYVFQLLVQQLFYNHGAVCVQNEDFEEEDMEVDDADVSAGVENSGQHIVESILDNYENILRNHCNTDLRIGALGRGIGFKNIFERGIWTKCRRCRPASRNKRHELGIEFHKNKSRYAGFIGKKNWFDRQHKEPLEGTRNDETRHPLDSNLAFDWLLVVTSGLLTRIEQSSERVEQLSVLLETLCTASIGTTHESAERDSSGLFIALLNHVREDILSQSVLGPFLDDVLKNETRIMDILRSHLRLGPIYVKVCLLAAFGLNNTFLLIHLGNSDLPKPVFLAVSLCACILLFEMNRLDILMFYIYVDKKTLALHDRWDDLQQSICDAVFHCIPRLKGKELPEMFVPFMERWLYLTVTNKKPSKQCVSVPDLDEVRVITIVECCDRKKCLLLKVVVLFLFGGTDQFVAAFQNLSQTADWIPRDNIATDKDQLLRTTAANVLKLITECFMALALLRCPMYKDKIGALLRNCTDILPLDPEFCSSVCHEYCLSSNITDDQRNEMLLSWEVLSLSRQAATDWKRIMSMLTARGRRDIELLDFVMDKAIDGCKYTEMLDLFSLYWEPGKGLGRALKTILCAWHSRISDIQICAKYRAPFLIDSILEKMDLRDGEKSAEQLNLLLFRSSDNGRGRRGVFYFSRNETEEKTQMVKTWINHGGTANLRSLCSCQRGHERGKRRPNCNKDNVLLKCAKAGLERHLVELLYEAGVCHPGCVRKQCKAIQKLKTPSDDVKEYLQTVWRTKIGSLMEITRITINQEIHCGPGRIGRVWNGLPLPNLLKRYLLFDAKTELIPMREVGLVDIQRQDGIQ